MKPARFQWLQTLLLYKKKNFNEFLRKLFTEAFEIHDDGKFSFYAWLQIIKSSTQAKIS